MNVKKVNINQSEQTYGIASDFNSVFDVDGKTLTDVIAEEKAAIIGTDRIADGAVTNSKIGTNFKKITPQIADTDDNDLNIADEDGNVLAEFCDGHIRTKEFDSKKIISDIEVEKSVDGKNKLIIKNNKLI